MKKNSQTYGFHQARGQSKCPTDGYWIIFERNMTSLKSVKVSFKIPVFWLANQSDYQIDFKQGSIRSYLSVQSIRKDPWFTAFEKTAFEKIIQASGCNSQKNICELPKVKRCFKNALKGVHRKFFFEEGFSVVG